LSERIDSAVPVEKPPTLAVGQVVADTYRVARRVGIGGMGEIYEATHLRLAGRYALKLLRPEIASNPDALARFEREARVTSALRHPNIVQVVDFSALPGGAAYMVMEFLDGLELAQLIKRTGPLPLPRVVSQVRQIAAGLTAAHASGVVHRDLKPQNVFVLDVAGHADELIKIVDFGISKVKDVTSTTTASSTLVGTVQYMSPEQARGRVDEIDARTDQFALAAIVYELLVGKDAFTGDSVSSLLYQIVHEEPAELRDGGAVPPPVATVLKRALAKDKNRRYASVLAFSAALEEAAVAGGAAAAKTISARRSALDVAPLETPRRRRALWVGTVAGIAIVGGWSLTRARRATVASTPATVTDLAAAAPEPPHAAPPVAPAPTPTAPAPAALPAGEPAAAPPARASLDEHRSGARPTRPRAAPKAPPRPTGAVAAPPTPAAKASHCDPNFYFDDGGRKHFKPECFLGEEPRP
jgi:serine/threonine-protein kinase